MSSGSFKNNITYNLSSDKCVCVCVYFSGLPPNQSMAQGRFIVGATHKSGLMYSRCKNNLTLSALL